jgi:uncharacterized protein YcbK (DUF882 family)
MSLHIHRRRLLAFGAMAAAAPLVRPAGALAAAPERSLTVLNLHTGERLRAAYYEGGTYLNDALAALNRVLRDHRTNEIHPIAPGVLDLAATLSDRLAGGGEVQIISGYRSPQSNAALHAASSGVATHSLHMQGMALDIRLPGVDLARLRDAALTLQRGGVGFYPGSDFVHVDVGRVRRWNG